MDYTESIRIDPRHLQEQFNQQPAQPQAAQRPPGGPGPQGPQQAPAKKANPFVNFGMIILIVFLGLIFVVFAAVWVATFAILAYGVAGGGYLVPGTAGLVMAGSFLVGPVIIFLFYIIWALSWALFRDAMVGYMRMNDKSRVRTVNLKKVSFFTPVKKMGLWSGIIIFVTYIVLLGTFAGMVSGVGTKNEGSVNAILNNKYTNTSIYQVDVSDLPSGRADGAYTLDLSDVNFGLLNIPVYESDGVDPFGNTIPDNQLEIIEYNNFKDNNAIGLDTFTDANNKVQAAKIDQANGTITISSKDAFKKLSGDHQIFAIPFVADRFVAYFSDTQHFIYDANKII